MGPFCFTECCFPGWDRCARWCESNSCLLVSEEVMLAEEDRNAEEKSPLDGAWYKRKQNNSGEKRTGALCFTALS
uniref:Uncharacterized protein n=1 Tax=Anguilla anguilla TaxID=7936 RepID=A0A0E9Q3G5_ANGAN